MLRKKVFYIVALLTLLLAGCSEDAIMTAPEIEEGEIRQDEEIQFTTLLPEPGGQTRSAKSDWNTEVNSYKPVNHAYTFKVEMYKEGENTPAGHSYYKPMKHTNIGATQIENYDGSLEQCTVQGDVQPQLYWQDNVNKWGFKATTVSSETIEVDQNDQTKWLRQDKLVGYSYLPIWTGTNDAGYGTDDFDKINYRTSKQWYADNKTAQQQSGLMVEEGSNGEEYKKVPLYMKHERAWITIILKAGEGVKREALKYQTAEENISMTINSYENGTGGVQTTAINKAWAQEYLIDYIKDTNGEAQQGVSTTRYDAIVAPHNYATRKDEEIIAKINLSNQNFSFYASNDTRYVSGTEEQKRGADDAYNLEAGKHLTIEATLSRESRKTLITAWIEDWTEVATQTICDDYGQNGDPVVIKNRTELIKFLQDPKVNKQGSVGIIQPTELSLDVAGDDGTWPQNLELKATLNLAGCVLKTGHRLFTNMSTSANLVNGTVEITDGAELDCAIAERNEGTIERVNVTTTSELTTAKATIAGMVKVNHGTIYQCSSTLPVYGTAGQESGVSEDTNKYIGGIAAVSTSSANAAMAVIDGCTVNASVNGTGVYGGGIVGYVSGRVSNSTFEYGISVRQEITNFKNIFAQAGASETRAYGNSWPTEILNYINESDQTTNPNNYPQPRYHAVLDCQEELDIVMNDLTNYNATGKVCRISKSFTVESSTEVAKDWSHGTANATDREHSVNNLSCILDGNDKTITLTGNKPVKTTNGSHLEDGDVTTNYITAPMLFNYILGEVKNLTIYLDESLVAKPSYGQNNTYNAEDAIAPLAYAVYGPDAKVTNVNVKAKNGSVSDTNTDPDPDPETYGDNAYVQAATPAGLVVWAYGGATISNCTVKVPVRMWLPNTMGGDARHYAGGIVACAAKATITECTYLGNTENSVSGSRYSTSAKTKSNFYYGGIVGGTSSKDTDTPELVITDCTSWFNAIRATEESVDKSSKGGVIGYCCYAEGNSSSTVLNGMKEGNVGNWWPLSAIGASKWLDGMNEEKVIGKRNSVTPSYNTDF